jgi:3D-(3,5/4)-trihydroxycyclohexane-1,2-dione acylhydrolase (decyclizing)
MATQRMTVAEALVRFLVAQHIEDDRDGVTKPLIPGVYAIFGHGNALGLGEALEKHRDQIRTIRGQNEEGMALAAVGYAKAARRRQVMAVTTSVGPGALNTVPAAGVAMANRLPLLLLLGDTFNSREPDPVLQQIEHFEAPTTTSNDALRTVSRYWDRITTPSQLLNSLPQAIGVLLDPEDTGPVTLALPQDVQAMAFDFPEEFFATRVHRIARARADRTQLATAVEILKAAKQPLILAGGGVHYSLAETALADFATKHNIPVMESVAGKSSLAADHPLFVGPIGVFAESASQPIAWQPDVVLAIGTRLQDFTTESGSVFKNPDLKLIGLNVGRWDSLKRAGTPLVGDARETLADLTDALGSWAGPSDWVQQAQASFAEQTVGIDARQTMDAADLPTYAQVVGVVNRIAAPNDYVVTSSGGLAGELVMNWRSKGVATFDCEYGFSCMGYEISGAWGAAMERAASDPSATVYSLLGDGSFMMLPMDIYSAVLTGQNLSLLVCDNGGFNVIERLQLGHGAASFKTMLADADHPTPPQIDFTAIAAGMGAQAHRINSLAELDEQLRAHKGTPGVHVYVIDVALHKWSEGDSFWEVGVPEVSHRPAVDQARAELLAGKATQRMIWNRNN